MSTQQGNPGETNRGTSGAAGGTGAAEPSLNWGSTRNDYYEQAYGGSPEEQGAGGFYVDDFNVHSSDPELRKQTMKRGAAGGYSLGGASTGITLLAGIGIGAILMYIFDPDEGRRRRALLRDQIVSCMNETSDIVGKKSRDLRNRAQGVIAQTTKTFRAGDESNDGGGARESQTSGARA